jgi:hypothetical protein
VATRYPLSEVQALACGGDIIFANKRAERNALELDWTMDKIVAFVSGLKARHHKGIRADLSIFNGRETIDADKYVARFNEETMSVTVDHRCCGFFVELALKTLQKGATVLIVSFHLDSQP